MIWSFLYLHHVLRIEKGSTIDVTFGKCHVKAMYLFSRLKFSSTMFFSTSLLSRKTPIGAIWLVTSFLTPFIVVYFTFLCLGFLLTESVSDAMQFSRFVSSMLGRFKFTVLTPFLFLCYSRKIMEPDVPHSLRLQSILIGRTISSNPPTTRSRWSSPRLPKTTTIPPR